MTQRLEFRGGVLQAYSDVYYPAALRALEALAPLNGDRRELMAARISRRAGRAGGHQRISFLEPDALIPRTSIRVQDARDGQFEGGEIPADLQRQWIQGTGPAARPRANLETGLRNVAYALLSGADGWMFDGEDALGQVSTMSLDNQRNLRLAIARDPLFLKVAEAVAVVEFQDTKRGIPHDFLMLFIHKGRRTVILGIPDPQGTDRAATLTLLETLGRIATKRLD